MSGETEKEGQQSFLQRLDHQQGAPSPPTAKCSQNPGGLIIVDDKGRCTIPKDRCHAAYAKKCTRQLLPLEEGERQKQEVKPFQPGDVTTALFHTGKGFVPLCCDSQILKQLNLTRPQHKRLSLNLKGNEGYILVPLSEFKEVQQRIREFSKKVK